MMKSRFSTVEMTVLGMTWLRGPCTIYAVMKELSSSASTYHKSRAGTAYSVANRLLKLGLLEKVDEDLVRLTPAGEEALRKWTGPDVPMMDVAHSSDLLRLRFFFLEVLQKEDRILFIRKSIESLREFEARCESLIPKNQEIGDYFGALATICSVLESRARISWLEMVQKWVEDPMPQDSDWTSTIMRELNSSKKPTSATVAD